MNTIQETIKNAVKHWYIPLIVGMLFLGLGIYTFLTPAKAYLALVLIFSISFLLSGLSELFFALANRKSIDHWGWVLAFGILNTAVGLLLVSKPEITAVTLPLYLGFVVMFRSVGAISYAYQLKHQGFLDWGNLMIFGILGVIFSFILIWNPVFAGLTIVGWTALAFLSIGAFSIFLSLRLRKIMKRLQ